MLLEKGVIGDWSARPLGMYSISAFGKELVRPDTKETAMWTMGALHGYAMAEVMFKAGSQMADDVRKNLDEKMTDLSQFGILTSWASNDDGTYTFRIVGVSETIEAYANNTLAWATGGLTGAVDIHQTMNQGQ